MAKKNEKQTKKAEAKVEKYTPKATVGINEVVAEVQRLVGEEAKQEDTVKAVFTAIQNLNAQDIKVQLIGFGNFEPRFRNAKKGRNPQTGEEIEISATKFPALKVGKGYKDAVANGTVVEPKAKKAKSPKVSEVAVTEEAEAPKASKKSDKKDKKKDKKKSKK